MSEVPKLWTVRRIGRPYEVSRAGYEDAVGFAERTVLDVLILCDGMVVASWTKKYGLVVLNKKLAGVR